MHICYFSFYIVYFSGVFAEFVVYIKMQRYCFYCGPRDESKGLYFDGP